MEPCSADPEESISVEDLLLWSEYEATINATTQTARYKITKLKIHGSTAKTSKGEPISLKSWPRILTPPFVPNVDLHHLVSLDLANNQLESIPEEIGTWFPNLTFLNLMSNRLSQAPSSLGKLQYLENLGLKGNQLTSLPPQIGELHSLVGLFLTDNKLTTLPDSVSGLIRLRKLQAADNRLRSLPDSIASCQQLELLRLANNQLDLLHESVSSAPNLKWLTVSSNPLCHTSSNQSTIRNGLVFDLDVINRMRVSKLHVISDYEIEMGQRLGEGASGVVYQCNYHGILYAAKMFKGYVSPDGNKMDEISASIILEHPSLTHVVAIIQKENDPVGLLLRFFEGDILADRPDFTSVLRSRWRAHHANLSREATLAIATCIADAMSYLHKQGLCHGDLYAHNIMFNHETNTAMLCDFGAASFYPAQQKPIFERIELRAYFLFLKELVSRSASPAFSEDELKTISGLESFSQVAHWLQNKSSICQSVEGISTG